MIYNCYLELYNWRVKLNFVEKIIDNMEYTVVVLLMSLILLFAVTIYAAPMHGHATVPAADQCDWTERLIFNLKKITNILIFTFNPTYFNKLISCYYYLLYQFNNINEQLNA